MFLGPPARYPTEQHGDDDDVLDSDDESIGKLYGRTNFVVWYFVSHAMYLGGHCSFYYNCDDIL